MDHRQIKRHEGAGLCWWSSKRLFLPGCCANMEEENIGLERSVTSAINDMCLANYSSHLTSPQCSTCPRQHLRLPQHQPEAEPQITSMILP